MNEIATPPNAQLRALLDLTHRNDKPNSPSTCQLDALLKKGSGIIFTRSTGKGPNGQRLATNIKGQPKFK